MRINDSIHSDQLPQSYYTDTCNDTAPFDQLTGDVRAEICIVGGGFTGVAAAVEMAERGYSVVLLEQNQIGWGASGRNGGQILGGYGPELADYDDYKKVYGDAGYKSAWSMASECVDIIRERVRKYGIECDLTWGYFDAAMNERELKSLREKKALLEELGYKPAMKYVEGAETRKIIGSDRFVGGLVNMGWGHCHPLNLVRGEARAAQKLGAKICENAQVQDIVYGNKVQLKTDNGTVTADKLILGCNAYLGELVPKLASKVLPTGSYVVATEPLDDALVAEIMPKNYAVCDLRWALDYFRLSADNRMLFGGLATYSGRHPKDLVKAVRPNMLKVFPQLKDVAITHTWGGYIGIGLNRIPQVGQLADNVYFAQAYSGHGVACTHMSARVIAEAIGGDKSRYDVLASVKHPVFPGGKLLRQPALAAGMAFYKMRDALGM